MYSIVYQREDEQIKGKIMDDKLEENLNDKGKGNEISWDMTRIANSSWRLEEESGGRGCGERLATHLNALAHAFASARRPPYTNFYGTINLRDFSRATRINMHAKLWRQAPGRRVLSSPPLPSPSVPQSGERMLKKCGKSTRHVTNRPWRKARYAARASQTSIGCPVNFDKRMVRGGGKGTGRTCSLRRGSINSAERHRDQIPLLRAPKKAGNVP